ncbi:MAG: hypothetical protein KAR22_25465, partial [Gammaproteobacteria bacterium]|nr:hypothetical protein [Gammaproteobacteria bacterium]
DKWWVRGTHPTKAASAVCARQQKTRGIDFLDPVAKDDVRSQVHIGRSQHTRRRAEFDPRPTFLLSARLFELS